MIWLLGCSEPGPPPSLLLVTLDTTRADRLTSYGGAERTSPSIDALAAEGVRFERAYTTAPQTLPAHTSILSGLYPPRHGVRVNGDGTVPDEVVTLAERLKAHGYYTAASIGAYVLEDTWNLDQGFDTYLDALGDEGDRWSRQRPASSVTKSVEEVIRTWPTDRPLFLWLHLYDPHEPYEAPGLFAARPDPYDAEISFADSQVNWMRGVVEHWAPDRPLAVVVVGDHGEGFGDPEEGHGTYLNPATTRVPFVIRPPDPLRAPVVVDTPVSVVDVVPTVLAMLGLPPAEGLDGQSLAAAIDGDPVPARPLYLEAESARTRWGWAPEVGVVDGGDVWVGAPYPVDRAPTGADGRWYDLVADPTFTTDRSAARSADGDRAAAFAAGVRAAGPVGPSHDLGGQVAQLEALGYTAGDGDRLGAAIDAKERRPQVVRMDQAREWARTPATRDRALEAWTALLAEDPALLEPRLGLVAAAEQAGDNERALTLLDEGLALSPDAGPMQLGRGRTLVALRRMPEAAEQARALLERDPADRNARDLLVSSLPVGESLAQIRTWQQLTPSDPFLHAKAGQVLVVMRDLLAAEPELRAAAAAPVPWIGVHRALAVVEMAKGDPEAAWGELTAEVKAYPEDPIAWYSLGEHLTVTGKLQAAVDLYQKLLARRPADRRARAALTEVLLKLGDVGQADQVFRPLVPTDRPYEMIVWANLLHAKGEDALGAEVFARAKAAMERR
ncbi:MAG: sulfatase-like hydrolase/transferase [Myxococcota bacterium]